MEVRQGKKTRCRVGQNPSTHKEVERHVERQGYNMVYNLNVKRFDFPNVHPPGGCQDFEPLYLESSNAFTQHDL
jgi:hypothetical protein